MLNFDSIKEMLNFVSKIEMFNFVSIKEKFNFVSKIEMFNFVNIKKVEFCQHKRKC